MTTRRRRRDDDGDNDDYNQALVYDILPSRRKVPESESSESNSKHWFTTSFGVWLGVW